MSKLKGKLPSRKIDLCPRSFMNDMIHLHASDLIKSSYRRLTLTGFNQLTNSPHFRISQLSSSMMGSTSLPILPISILSICFRGSQEQMSRAHASGIITSMQNVEGPVEGTIHQKITQPRSRPENSIQLEMAHSIPTIP